MMRFPGIQFRRKTACTSFGALFLAAAFCAGATPPDEPLATLNDGGDEVFWTPNPDLNYYSMVLSVSGPEDFSFQEEFFEGDDPFMIIGADGTYAYELHMVPVGVGKSQNEKSGSAGQSEDANGRSSGSAAAAGNHSHRAEKRGPVQSGYFTIDGGMLADAEETEE